MAIILAALSLPVLTTDALDQVLVLAQTIFGEAEGEPPAAKLAVGVVIRNRVRRGWRGKHTYREVCLDPLQFSCWNDGSQRLAAMLRPRGRAWHDSLSAAWQVVFGQYDRPELEGVLHYTDTSLAEPPAWARNMTEVRLPDVPRFRFWRG